MDCWEKLKSEERNPASRQLIISINHVKLRGKLGCFAAVRKPFTHLHILETGLVCTDSYPLVAPAIVVYFLGDIFVSHFSGRQTHRELSDGLVVIDFWRQCE